MRHQAGPSRGEVGSSWTVRIHPALRSVLGCLGGVGRIERVFTFHIVNRVDRACRACPRKVVTSEVR